MGEAAALVKSKSKTITREDIDEKRLKMAFLSMYMLPHL
jgi:hypothetical protein